MTKEGEEEAGKEEEKAKANDPMENDVFDSDEAQNRRCEAIETSGFGSIFARCVSTAPHPLIPAPDPRP